MQKKIIEKPEMFKNMVGEFLGYSNWKLVTQKEINNFATATEDFQWIHVNEKKAALKVHLKIPLHMVIILYP